MRSASTAFLAFAAFALAIGARADTVATPRPAGRHWNYSPSTTTTYPSTHGDDVCVGAQLDPSDLTWSSPCGGKHGKCCNGLMCKEYDGEISLRIGDKYKGIVTSNLAPYQVYPENPVPPEADFNVGECCIPQKGLRVTNLFCEDDLSNNNAVCDDNKFLLGSSATKEQKNNAACSCCDGLMNIGGGRAVCNPINTGGLTFRCPDPMPTR